MNLKTKFKLPFVYQLHQTPSNPPELPNSLGFEVEYDESLMLLKQKYSLETDEYLRQAYELGSVIGGNTLEDEIGDRYTHGVLDYLESTLHEKEYSGKKILEIGCGIGYLLNKIKLKNGDVTGIEPGIQGQIGAKKYDIRVLQGFYPGVDIDDKFDIIVSYCVLEHVSDPLSFLTNLKPLLKPQGKVFMIVPNEKPYIDTGDISTLFHQHWSYFVEDSLRNLYLQAGACDINITGSEYGGLLFSNFSFNNKEVDRGNIDNTNTFSYNHFFNSATENAKKITQYLSTYQDVGVYVPMRIVNYLINQNINMEGIRFFDDDQYNYGNFFPGIDIKIENFNDFLENPPSRVIIMSHFFEKLIKDKIRNSVKRDLEITLWSEIFSKSNN